MKKYLPGLGDVQKNKVKFALKGRQSFVFCPGAGAKTRVLRIWSTRQAAKKASHAWLSSHVVLLRALPDWIFSWPPLSPIAVKHAPAAHLIAPTTTSLDMKSATIGRSGSTPGTCSRRAAFVIAIPTLFRRRWCAPMPRCDGTKCGAIIGAVAKPLHGARRGNVPMAIAKRKKGDLAVAQVSTPRGRNLCGFGLVTAGPRELRAYV